MKVTASDQVFDIDIPTEAFKPSYKEGVAIEEATGKDFTELSPLKAAGAIVWLLIRRQGATVSFGDIDFDLEEFGEAQPAPKEADSPTTDVPT